MAKTELDIGANPDSRPWFIHDQEWSVLTVPCQLREKVKWFCQPKFYRLTADGVSADQMEEFNRAFTPCRDKSDVALNRPIMQDRSRQIIDFRLTAIIADAGVGKTILTRWIEYRCNQPDSRVLAFRFDLRTVVQRHGLTVDNVSTQLIAVMADRWFEALSEKTRQNLSSAVLRQHLHARMRRPGELLLILDGLDQCSAKDLDVLASMVQSRTFDHCRFVVAGRPQAYTTNWSPLFSDNPWQLVHVKGMRQSQQIRYLGRLSDGRLRYDQIPRGARPLLGNPRILSYMRLWTTFADIRTAADVYWKAIDRFLYDGMSRSEKAARIGLSAGAEPRFDSAKGRYDVSDQQVLTAIGLLSIIAFETKRFCQKSSPTWTADWPKTGKLPSPPERAPPKYDYNVVAKGEVDKLRRVSIKERVHRARLDGDFETNWDGLAALNSGFLDHGIFEDGRGGLKELIWANKSLHEFLLAYFFANFATRKDTYYLWDWIYLKDQYGTEDYYWFWQYLCEMHSDARNKECWLNAIRMIYQPNIYRRAADRTKRIAYAKRSSEMIFRSWWTLHDYLRHEAEDDGPAHQILNRWRGEFERIRGGEFGAKAKTTAEQIVDHLLYLDLSKIGRFKMGTRPEKQGFHSTPAEFQQVVRLRFDDWHNDPHLIVAYFDDFVQSKATINWRESYEPKYRAWAGRSDTDAAFLEFVNDVFPANEAEIPYENLPSESFPNFGIGRYPISNRFFRLFDRSHGLRDSDLWPNYRAYSRTGGHPAVFVSFYDAWVCSRFLYWDEVACQLPHEDQWECAAKYGFGWDNWDQAYWWGDDFNAVRDKTRINCFETGYCKTLVPSSERANRWTIEIDPQKKGLSDMLGGVWEWCEDPFPSKLDGYCRRDESLFRDPHVSRAVRGASFHDDAILARCSIRNRLDPVFANFINGFRVARANPENL